MQYRDMKFSAGKSVWQMGFDLDGRVGNPALLPAWIKIRKDKTT
jgi:hypothetical protein